MTKSRTRRTRLRAHDLIREPLLNKGSAFTHAERASLGLEGLLPHRAADIELQAQRVYRSLKRFDDPLEQYVALAALQDRNEHLYFYLLGQHLEELMPVVYTPTVGLATRHFSHVFQRGRGIWVTPDHRGRIVEVLRTGARGRDIRLIVVTDNESILGIGDQGAGGMAISIGKLALYTAGAGIDPATVLPVSLDFGTGNEALRADPMYLGWPESRLRGDDYDALVDEFVGAVTESFPRALLQWEDFRKDTALRVMDRYRDRVLSFNDDIQGTGAVSLAGLLAAARIHKRPLSEERVVIFGAGAAGLGIARQIRAAMQDAGLDGDALTAAIAVLDSRGLIVAGRERMDDYKAELAWSADLAAAAGLSGTARDLAAVCEAWQPTVLIGTSGQQGAFEQRIVRGLADAVARPVIMPLSNPTDQAEATPADLYEWTGGQAIIAAGSPFPDVSLDGRNYRVGQGNNAFIFPGVGLGALAAEASRVTDSMLARAADALAGAVSENELADGLIYPPIERLHEAAAAVAQAVFQAAIDAGVAEERSAAEIESRLEALRWSPEYPEYVPE